jgi:flagellar motor protein MotB
VESKRGRTEIDVSVANLAPPTRFGREYLTYTLWAITPEGAPHNIGEVIPNGSDKARIHVTTDLQAFGLIVTAEPYSAAHQPSDVVVLENQVRADTIGQIKEIHANYALMPRGHYTYDVANKVKAEADAPKVSMGRYEALLELYEAQNATAIARSANAERYAPQTLAKAEELLANAQQLEKSKAASSVVVQLAREAVQTAEDARAIAEKRAQEEKVATLQAQTAQAQLAQAQAQGEANRLRIEVDSVRAEAERERTARQRAEADADSARQQTAPAVMVAPPPPPAAQPQGDAQKGLRMRLLEQLNGVLSTRDTPRGLVATVTDVSFSGTELRGPVAAGVGRLAAVLQAHPELRIVVEGYSDGAATEAQARNRAERVRQMLVADGLPGDRCVARGLGDSRPLGSNSGAAGREQNRRVEIVISGESIGAVPFWDHTYSLMENR